MHISPWPTTTAISTILIHLKRRMALAEALALRLYYAGRVAELHIELADEHILVQRAADDLVVALEPQLVAGFPKLVGEAVGLLRVQVELGAELP